MQQDLNQAINCIRDDVRAAHAYPVQSSAGMVKLDVMENPFRLSAELQRQLGERLGAVAINRYPAERTQDLATALARHAGMPEGCAITLGNGSDELISMLSLATAKPGAKALSPVPSFVMYEISARYQGLEFIGVPLRADFELDGPAMLKAIAEQQPVLIYLAYPNNPTAGMADRAFFEKAVALAHKYGFVIAQDAAYNEMYYEEPALSILEIPGGKEVSVEFHSLSKTFNMTGWRVGFAVGNPAIVGALGQVKSNTDSGIFTSIQMAAKTALDGYDEITPGIRDLYKERRDAFVSAMRKAGWNVPTPKSTFYVWMPCPAGISSTELSGRLLDEASVVMTPGLGFGRTADGYIRAALTVETPRLLEAVDRISKLTF